MEDTINKNAASDFVCVEDVGKLSIDHEVLQKRVEQLERSLSEIQRARQEAQTREQMKWRILKATALLALLATLAIIHEQHDRAVSFGSVMGRINARSSNGINPSAIGRYHHLRNGRPDDLSSNAPLLLCFIVGLPYLVFTIVLYVIEVLDIGSDQDLRSLVGAALLHREPETDSDDDNDVNEDTVASAEPAAAVQPIGDAPVFMSAPQLSSMDLTEEAGTTTEVDNCNNNTAAVADVTE